MPFPLTDEQIKTLEAHIGARRQAFKTHEKYLALEMAGHDRGRTNHAITRHGYQTGWESQLVRLMTGETPDQPFARTGVRGMIAAWERSSGDTATLPPRPQYGIRYAAANSVGAFLGPDIIKAALNSVVLESRELQRGVLAEMTTRKGGGSASTWCPFEYIECIVKTPFQYSGVSFVRDQSKPLADKATFEQAFNDYLTGTKVLAGDNVSAFDQTLFKQAMASGSDVPTKLKDKVRKRFTNLGDLLAFLHVEGVMMRNVRIVLRRMPKNGQPGKWILHTAFAVNEAASLRPDAPGKWTGWIKTSPGGEPQQIAKFVV